MSWPESPPVYPTTLHDLQLSRWKWGIEAAHWRYNASSPTRCTGVDGEVDCSGAECVTVNYALTELHEGLMPIPQNSSSLSRICHNAPREQWMNDHFGPDPWSGSVTVGTGLSAGQANVTPAAFAFHGPDQGLNGDGPAGHIKSKWYLNDGIHPMGTSVEAMGVHAGVGYSTFLDAHCTYFAWPPWFGNPFETPQPQLVEPDMLVFICPNKPVDKNGNTPHAEFWPAGSNPFLPNGGFLLHWGASLAGDQGRKSPDDPHARMLVPAGNTKWIGAAQRASGGLMVVNEHGQTSHGGSPAWS